MRTTVFAILMVLLVGLMAGGAQAEVLTFEDLYDGYYDEGPLPVNYGGFLWSNTYYMAGTYNLVPGSNGYDLTRNGRVGIYTPWAQSIAMADGEFNLVSMRVGAAWNDNQQARFQGYRDGSVVYDWIFDTPFGNQDTVWFWWENIDQLVMAPYGTGTLHSSGGSGTGSEHLVMDDIEVSDEPFETTPELSSSALLLLGALPMGLAWLRRRRTG